MRSLTWALLASLAALGAPSAARPEDAAVVDRLTRNAWYWQARGREDRAADAWNQVLVAAPNDFDALVATGGFQARAGRLEEARQILARLQEAHPGHPDLRVLERQIELGPRFDTLLAQARKLLREGHVEEGAARYRELVGGAGPPGALALDYYQALGGTRGGWKEARDGLRNLVRKVPFEARCRLALAKVLTYREETRHEGIAMLERLARDPAVAQEADASWRQAVLWLAPSSTEAPLLRAFAERHPDDPEVAARLGHVGHRAEQARKGDAVRSGFEAVDRGDLRTAEERFRSAPKGDPAAALGLAIVAQREAIRAQRDGNLPLARALLERAKRLAPDRPDVWQEQLRSVTFWSLMQEARADREAGRDEDAEAKLVEATAHAPAAERWHADLALGDLHLARKQYGKAEARYRDVLASVPDEPGALRALTSLLVESGRYAEALPFNERLAGIDPAKAFSPGWIAAEDHRARAAADVRAGRLDVARAELQTARDLDPDDIWVLHDLANLQLRAGALRDARPVVARLRALAPELPEGRALEGRLLAAEGEKAKALEILSALPPRLADAGIRALLHRLQVDVEVPAIVERARRGSRAAAARDLESLEEQVAPEPELAATVAVAWAKLGELDRAVRLMRVATARAPAATRGMRLELASILLEAGDDARLRAILGGLEDDPALSVEQRRDLAELRVVESVRSADRLRERGDVLAAFRQLTPLLRTRPGDPRLLSALGRVYERAQDHENAYATFLRVLAQSPEDLEARRGAVEAAVAMGDLREARRLSAEAMRRQPDEPRAHLLAARLALRSGDDDQAMQSLGEALARAERQLPEPADLARPTDLQAEIRREMERVRERHRADTGGTFELRRREGEPGLSALTELRENVAAAMPVAYRGRAELHVSLVALDASPLDTGGDVARRFGSGQPAPAAAGVAIPQQARGTEIALGYSERDFAVEVGTTPLGFPIQTVVGSVRLRQTWGSVRLSAEAARRRVTDSLLSYAGTTDPATGSTWGGVVQEGGRLELALVRPRAAVWAYGGFDVLSGIDVADNRDLAAGAGTELKLYHGTTGDFLTGLTLAGFGYEKNLRYFTLGHGGYFSPQRFAHAGLPLKWKSAGKVRFEATAEPGLDGFEEASTPEFPLGDTAAGSALVNGPERARAARPAEYPGRTRLGFAMRADALLGFVFADRIEASVSVKAQEAEEFQEVRAAVLLKYLWGAGDAGRGGR